jgi:hypothetical protein
MANEHDTDPLELCGGCGKRCVESFVEVTVFSVMGNRTIAAACMSCAPVMLADCAELIQDTLILADDLIAAGGPAS